MWEKSDPVWDPDLKRLFWIRPGKKVPDPTGLGSITPVLSHLLSFQERKTLSRSKKGIRIPYLFTIVLFGFLNTFLWSHVLCWVFICNVQTVGISCVRNFCTKNISYVTYILSFIYLCGTFHANDIFNVRRIFSLAMAVVMSTCYYSFISGFTAWCFDASRVVEKQAQCATGQ